MTALTMHRVVARAGDGLSVDVDTGDGIVRADMPAARGGGGTAPTPGSIMRASVASCLAVGYKSWSEKLGVPLSSVEVELSTGIDLRGQNDEPGVAPGWQSITWHVRVTSNASDADVERVLSHADRLSPMLDSLHPRCERKRTFEVRRGG